MSCVFVGSFNGGCSMHTRYSVITKVFVRSLLSKPLKKRPLRQWHLLTHSHDTAL